MIEKLPVAGNEFFDFVDQRCVAGVKEFCFQLNHDHRGSTISAVENVLPGRRFGRKRLDSLLGRLFRRRLRAGPCEPGRFCGFRGLASRLSKSDSFQNRNELRLERLQHKLAIGFVELRSFTLNHDHDVARDRLPPPVDVK